MCVHAKCTYAVREEQSSRGVAAAAYMNSVSLMCQGRKPSVLSTGPNFKTSSGSGIFLESARAQRLHGFHTWLTQSASSHRRQAERSSGKTRTFAAAVSSGTSEDNVQHGDADVFGAHRFVLHRAAELLSCLDDALLPIL